ncbi:PHP domain-containing protein [Simiduia sp. 21SJ11W-1]|nr:PHP domain-containing protein [Simiduia sp. 21SJ11W-1]
MSRAKQRGVTLLAVTDHDTLASYPEAQAAAAAEAIALLPGIEISTTWRGRGIHVVGLGFDPEHPVLTRALKDMHQVREARALAIARALAKAGLSGEQDILRAAQMEAGEGSIGRPHFARALVKLGKVSSQAAAFKRFLGNGKPGDVKQDFPEVQTAVQLISAAGGVAVLAHPLKYSLTRTKMRELLGDFIEAGGQAVELISGYQEPTATADLARQLAPFGVHASIGSDFHLPDQRWQELGCAGHLPEGLPPVWALPALAEHPAVVQAVSV